MLPAQLLLASVTLATVALAGDKVWVVDPSGAGDFVEIADALTGEGWTVLVRPGVYTASSSRSLSVRRR